MDFGAGALSQEWRNTQATLGEQCTLLVACALMLIAHHLLY